MSRRIAHRARYRSISRPVPPLKYGRQNFLPTRWTYRRQKLEYVKRPLGYSLSFFPILPRTPFVRLFK